MSGQLFPQPIKFDGSEIKERCDYLLGDNFSLISTNEIVLSKDEEDFLTSIDTKILLLDKELNKWRKLNNAPIPNKINSDYDPIFVDSLLNLIEKKNINQCGRG